MKFSILIAHYNNDSYFKDCYNSLLKQTIQNFEIIIVDDGSTNNSLEKIKEMTKDDDRVKIFRNKVNSGVGYTKKRCVDVASGDICGFLDPDDALLPTAIEECLNAYTHEKIIAVYTQFYICDGFLNIVKTSPKAAKMKNDLFFFNINFQVGHFFSFKKHIYLQTSGINPDLKAAEDQDLYMKLAELGSFYFLEKPLYKYRTHEKGLSQDKKKKKDVYLDWDKALLATLNRRGISKLYGKSISNIVHLSSYIYEKQNSLWIRMFRKLNRFLN